MGRCFNFLQLTKVSSMNKSRTFLLFCLLFLSLNSGKLYAQFVAVVNSENPINSLSMIQLRSIYLGEITTWEFDRKRSENIILVDYRQKTKSTEQFYKIVTGLSQSRIRLEWLGKILNGEFQILPVKLSSETDILKYISKNVGAIGFVDAESFNAKIYPIKAIKIGGKNFKDKNYPLK